MPGGSYYQANIKCPYYAFDNGKDRIACEGVIPNTQVQSYFKGKKDFRVQINEFCSKSYWCCEVCSAIDEKYKDGE